MSSVVGNGYAFTLTKIVYPMILASHTETKGRDGCLYKSTRSKGIPFGIFTEMDSYSGMTVADLNSDALARHEAKLMADLDLERKVRKVRALLKEHQMTPASVFFVISC